MFGLPIYDLHRDLYRLEREISSTDKVRVAVIDYLSAYMGEDVEQAIKGFGGAFSALKDFAAKFEVAVIPLCRLPCHGGSGVITRAIDALSVIPGVDLVLLVEGTARGTVVRKKTWAGLDAKAVAFRTSKKPGCSEADRAGDAVLFETAKHRQSLTCPLDEDYGEGGESDCAHRMARKLGKRKADAKAGKKTQMKRRRVDPSDWQ